VYYEIEKKHRNERPAEKLGTYEPRKFLIAWGLSWKSVESTVYLSRA
jgi:hypothetical protein